MCDSNIMFVFEREREREKQIERERKVKDMKACVVLCIYAYSVDR